MGYRIIALPKNIRCAFFFLAKKLKKYVYIKHVFVVCGNILF